MKLDPHSAEFADLIDRWLDETATEEEAARLWQAVSECPDCARELAAAARFESLLGATVQERVAEKKVLPAVLPPAATLPLLPARSGSRPGVWRQPGARWLLAAAAVILAGFFTALFWQQAGEVQPEIAAHEAVAPIPQPPVRRLPGPVEKAPPSSPEAAETALAAQVPLVERLDRFFLTGVALDQVPLSRAIGILQGQLREVNYEDKLALDQLRVLVPTDASQRRVTFYSGPIPFLKAVRAVAALAGCDVVISEPQITITIQQSIYPQIAEKRVLSDMLAGRLNAGGTALVDDPTRVAALHEDAGTLGVVTQADGTASMTRGQWEALKMLTETRDYIGSLPLPVYEVYAVDDKDAEEAKKLLSPAEVATLRQQARDTGAQPLLTFSPQSAGPQNRDLVQLEPVGDTVALTLNPKAAVSSNPSAQMGPQPNDPLILGGIGSYTGSSNTVGRSLDLRGSGDSLEIKGALVKFGAGEMRIGSTSTFNSAPTTLTLNSNAVPADSMAALTSWATANGATLVIVPVTPPP